MKLPHGIQGRGHDLLMPGTPQKRSRSMIRADKQYFFSLSFCPVSISIIYCNSSALAFLTGWASPSTASASHPTPLFALYKTILQERSQHPQVSTPCFPEFSSSLHGSHAFRISGKRNSNLLILERHPSAAGYSHKLQSPR